MSLPSERYERLKERLCPRCPIRRTCPQFAEQLDACADAWRLLREPEEPPQADNAKDDD